MAVDRKRRWRITRKGTSSSDSSEMILGFLCDCSLLGACDPNLHCQYVGTLLPAPNVGIMFHSPQEDIPNHPLQSNALFLQIPGAFPLWNRHPALDSTHHIADSVYLP